MSASNSTLNNHPDKGLSHPKSNSVACFAVTAERDPGTLPRILEPFAKRGLTPRQVHVSEDLSEGGHLMIDVQMAGMDLETAAKIGSGLDQLFGVRSVLVSNKITG